MSGKQKTVALFGLGNMGFEMARRLATSCQLVASDLDGEQRARAQAELGAEPYQPHHAATLDAVILCLPSPAASLAVLREIGPSLRAGTVVIETSTVNPTDIHAEHALLAPHGVALIDASILAGVAQMRDGKAALALGGAPEHIAAVQSVLDACATRQIHFGALGSGAAAKVINNAVAHAVMAVVVEAGALATATGVDHQKLIAMLSDSEMGLHRPLTYRYAQRILSHDYAGGMPLDAARKDSILVLQLAQQLGVPLFAIHGAHAVYDMAAAAGHGRSDYAAIARLWEGWGVPATPAASAE